MILIDKKVKLMNILVISHYGLYENLSFSFIHNQIKEFVKEGNKVKVIIPIAVAKKDFESKRFGRILKKRVVEGIELYYIRYVSLSKYGNDSFNYQSAKMMLSYQLNKIIKDFKPSIIHAHTIEFDGEIGVFLKERLGCPLVITTHGSDTIVPMLHNRSTYIKKICDNANIVVAVSEHLKRVLSQCGTNTPIKVIYNGHNFNANKRNYIKQRYSIIQVGHLIAQKNFDKTIKAFSLVKKYYPESILKIIGSGNEYDNLKALCSKLDLTNSVVFLGEVDNDTVLTELAKSELFIMPSIREGFGIVYLEAMSNGCVTIGSKGEAISELIQSGINGILVDPNDIEQISNVIKDCFNDIEYMNLLSMRGRESVKQLTWKENAQKYISLFQYEIDD